MKNVVKPSLPKDGHGIQVFDSTTSMVAATPIDYISETFIVQVLVSGYTKQLGKP